MTQVNCCLKWLLTIFNIIFAIVGIIIIVVTLNSQFTYANGALALDVHTFRKPELYIVGSIIMVIAILGAVGAYRESKACMILFLVCMILGSIVMLLPGTLLAVIRPQVASMQEETYRGYLPLDKAPADKRHEVDSMQREMQCCGLFSYKDWEGNIPDSCLCNKLEEMEGKCQTVDYRGVVQQKKSVYIQACFPIVGFSILLLVDIGMAIFFTLAVLGLLGMVLSSIMIHQLRNPSKPVFLMMAPPFTKSPKYEELHNVLPPKYY
ncbi:tetraspanin-8-like [Sander lucioperca]|uniref:tetraspanin-8-like n=1 Tax=Sander lucioperca TaxID=283035 RepID=UPI00125CE157|nr:tetraspanin-8-like [Sander lucioperca]